MRKPGVLYTKIERLFSSGGVNGKMKEEYKETIIKMIQKVENEQILEYLSTFIKLFIEKWGR